MSRRPNTRAPRSRAPGRGRVQAAQSPGPGAGTAAATRVAPPPTPRAAAPRAPGARSFRRAPRPTGTRRRAEGPRGAAGQTVPPATDAARGSSQCLRAGFTAPASQKQGTWGQGSGVPRVPAGSAKPCPVLAIKSTSDETKRAREGVDRRGGGTDLSMRILWSPIQGMRCCPCSKARARSSSRNSLQA